MVNASMSRNFSSYLLVIAALVLCGCASKEPSHDVTEKPAATQATHAVAEPTLPDQQVSPNTTPEPQPRPFEGSGETAWARGLEGELIAGINGELYEAYAHDLIKRVQRALTNRGLYMGPINGVLDRPTEAAIYEFQKATGTLQLCGIPTPRTRQMLEQGSHTDPTS
jgi:hypothetical protein